MPTAAAKTFVNELKKKEFIVGGSNSRLASCDLKLPDFVAEFENGQTFKIPSKYYVRKHNGNCDVNIFGNKKSKWFIGAFFFECHMITTNMKNEKHEDKPTITIVESIDSN